MALHKWRIENRNHLSRSQREELDDREVALLKFASSNFPSGIGMILNDSQTSLSRLQGSVKHAESEIDHIWSFKQALDLASALILFAAAIASGNGAEIPAGIVVLDRCRGCDCEARRPRR